MIKMDLRYSTAILCVLGGLSFHEAIASKLKVVNEKPNDIKIRIIPEPATTEKSSNPIVVSGVKAAKDNLQGKHHISLQVTPADIAGKTHYAISGETGLFLGDKCRNLSVAKHYEISFQDNLVGTTCRAEEVPESMFNE